MCSVEEEDVVNVPALSAGKLKHFFVSYSSEDGPDVLPVINDLEERFQLSCFYSDRDFQAGKDIATNIRDGMSVSMKVLLFLTPDFLKSGWCKFETDAAFATSLGCGYSCIVPVLLRECEIPVSLVTLTYIDGTITGTDIPARIASAISSADTNEQLFQPTINAWNRMRENGYCYVIDARRDDVLSIRPAKYKFVVDSDLCIILKDYFIEMPYELLEQAVGIVNKHPVMSSFDYLSRLKNFCWGFLLLPWLIMIYGLIIMYNIASTPAPAHTDYRLLIALDGTRMLVIFIVLQCCVCCLPNICHRKARDISLQRKLWTKLGKQFMDNNVLILFTSRRNKRPTLHIMRYNIQRCKEHLVEVLRSRNERYDLSHEEYAERAIEKHLANATETLANDFDSLPDAPFNRHNVKKGRMCICQQLERDL